MFVSENIATHFGVEYKSGKSVFWLRQWGRKGLSYEANGIAIPARTYLTFARTLVDAWMNSPRHREAILEPEAQYTGFACSPEWPGKGSVRDEAEFHKYYCVQVFYTPLPR